MDFKVCGTREGITAIQLDIKIEGIDYNIIRDTLHRAKEARLVILDKMAADAARAAAGNQQVGPAAAHRQDRPAEDRQAHRPGRQDHQGHPGRNRRQIDIEDDGTVYICAVDGAAAEKCRDIVEAMTAEVKVGKIYTGRVVSIKDFGAFVEIAPETDGLCHVSELSDHYVERVTDVVNIGDEVQVKVILIDDQGRIKLSRKAAMKELGIASRNRSVRRRVAPMRAKAIVIMTAVKAASAENSAAGGAAFGRPR